MPSNQDNHYLTSSTSYPEFLPIITIILFILRGVLRTCPGEDKARVLPCWNAIPACRAGMALTAWWGDTVILKATWSITLA